MKWYHKLLIWGFTALGWVVAIFLMARSGQKEKTFDRYVEKVNKLAGIGEKYAKDAHKAEKEAYREIKRETKEAALDRFKRYFSVPPDVDG